MNNRPSSILYGVSRPMILCIFLFSCSSHADKRARNTNLPFPQHPEKCRPFIRTSNAPLSRPRETSWRSHTSHRTYEPSWGDGPFGVSSERPYASRADRVEAPPRPIHVEPADTAQQDLKEGCEICCEEDAYKDYGATQCSECKKYIYQQCHDNIENAARGRQEYSYNTGQEGPTFQTTFACPFCKKPF